MYPKASEVVPMFHPLRVGDLVPEDGRVKLPDRPGWQSS
jgi:L-rhamnonate dehydratase